MTEEFEEEAEQTVSIQEYLNGVEEQELEADLVLGGDEGKECTYVNGYMKRQAIFSCLTCAPDGNAGVCTACSLACHDGHEIVELWTKRNFRCDCGNSKFGEFFCKLLPSKDTENGDNSYNHNFKGLYCICGRPYPDPDIEEQVEMIQCCVCEDWFHEEHLGLESPEEIPRDEEGEPQYEDFICEACSEFFSFLILYPRMIWATVMKHDEVKGKDVMEDVPSNCNSHDICSQNPLRIDHSVMTADSEIISNGKTSSRVNISEKPAGSNQLVKDASSSGTCALGVDLAVASPAFEKRKPLFLSKNWRDRLCGCAKCLDFYSVKHISYLLDKEDSIAEYEKMAKEKREQKLQQQEGVEMNFLSKLGHVEKMEFLSGIADMKNEIHSFLESRDSSKPITSDDVHLVFKNLAKKRRREQ